MVHGRELLGETVASLEALRAAIRGIEGLEVLDERLCAAPGVSGYDPLRLVIDVRASGASGYELERLLRRRDDVNMELAGENVLVGIFGMGEDAAAQGKRLLDALRHVMEELPDRAGAQHEAFAPPPPWGELAMTPREAFFGPQEVLPARDAVGRVAAESLAAYPPGIPNVLPGERLTADSLDYIQRALDHGGMLRGASDRKLRTLRVAVER